MLVTAGIQEFIDQIAGLTGVIYAYIAYGTGTTAESAAQTTLVSETDREPASIQRISVLAPLDTYRFYYAFTTAAAVGVAEVGLFSAAAGGTMLDRILLDNVVTTRVDGKLLVIIDVTIKDGNDDGSAAGC